jgi:hypothetical protein
MDASDGDGTLSKYTVKSEQQGPVSTSVPPKVGFSRQGGVQCDFLFRTTCDR